MKKWTCYRVGKRHSEPYTWMQRGNEKPNVCPKCKSPYWDKKRKLVRV